MRKLLVLTVAVAFAVAGCSSDEDGSEDATATTTQADDQTTDTSDASDSADGEGESTGSEAPDGMLEACNGANFYTDPGDVPEVSISSEEERTAIEQKAALSQPITGFEVVEGPNVEGGYLGFGETDGWAWYCAYGSDSGDAAQVFYNAFQAPTAINGVVGPEDGRWDSTDLG